MENLGGCSGSYRQVFGIHDKNRRTLRNPPALSFRLPSSAPELEAWRLGGPEGKADFSRRISLGDGLELRSVLGMAPIRSTSASVPRSKVDSDPGDKDEELPRSLISSATATEAAEASSECALMSLVPEKVCLQPAATPVGPTSQKFKTDV